MIRDFWNKLLGPPQPAQPVDPRARVHWTARARAAVEPHRDSAQAGSARVVDAERAVAVIQGAVAGRRALIEGGLPEADAERRRLMRAVLAACDEPASAWLRDPDLDVDAARAALLDFERRGARAVAGSGSTYCWAHESELDDAWLDSWWSRGGPAHALEMLVRCHAHELVWRNSGLCLDPRENWPERIACSPEGIWLKLRGRLASCPESEHAQARDAAARLRGQVPPALRCSLAYAFPDLPGWAAEDAARALAGEKADGRETWLLASLTSPELAERLVVESGSYMGVRHVSTMIDRLGPAAARPLAALFVRSRSWAMQARRKLAQSICLIESAEVASFFAANLDDPATTPAAASYFERFSDLALPALREAADADQPRAAELLTALHSKQLANPEAPGRDMRSAAPAPSVAPDMPPVLATPPWSIRRKPPSRPRVLPGIVPLVESEAIDWKPGEREFLISGRGLASPFSSPGKPGTPEQRQKVEEQYLGYFRRALTTAEKVHLNALFWLSDETALATWNSFPPGKYEFFDAPALHRILAQHELAALPGFSSFADVQLGHVVEVLARVMSPRVAPLMARAHAELTRGRRIASEWFRAHPREASLGVIPQAVGEAGTPRRQAEAALRFLASQGTEEETRRAADAYGGDVATAVEKILAFDPYQQFPSRLPELTQLFWTPARWPRPRLDESGQELPDAAVEALGTMLAFSPLDDPYVGIADVKRACDPRGLAEFAWALFEAWQQAGMPANGEWAFRALGLLGDDETARRLADIVEPMSSEGRHGRAVSALRILAQLGSDAAVSRVRQVSEKAKSRPLRTEARAQLVQVAERRGLTADQLADLLVPGLELDRDGARSLDFGPRQFRVGLDERLEPQVRDADRRLLRDLPEPGVKDDAPRARAAVAEWKAFKKQVRTVVRAELARFEQAMCSGRRWEADELERVVVAHPVLGAIARRLVFAAYDEAGAPNATFRVCEDGTFADAADAGWRAPPGCPVGVVHSVELSDAERRRWSERFVDYELIQPFPQLAREAFRASPGDLQSRVVTRAEGSKVAPRKLLGLGARGWDPVHQGSHIPAMTRLVPWLGCEAVLPLDPGLFAGDITASPEQALGPVVVRRRGSWSEEDCLPIAAMGPILYSELVRDLEWLLG